MRHTIEFLLLGFLLISCSRRNDSNKNAFELDSLQKEALKITLINDSTNTKWTNKEYSKIWYPTKSQMSIIDSIIVKGIKENNRDSNRRLNTNSFKDYYRQYICHVQQDGDSIVFINAICKIWYDPAGVREDWQHELIEVKDGGDCFWQIGINFSKRMYYIFMINGLA
jgi:hypothetical protein